MGTYPEIPEATACESHSCESDIAPIFPALVATFSISLLLTSESFVISCHLLFLFFLFVFRVSKPLIIFSLS